LRSGDISNVLQFLVFLVLWSQLDHIDGGFVNNFPMSTVPFQHAYNLADEKMYENKTCGLVRDG
jgi:hypothetical protein